MNNQAKQTKKDFTLRGKLLSNIEAGIYSFKVLYGYPLSWVGEPMYTGPMFPIHNYEPSSGFIFDIDLSGNNISVQDAEFDDMMYLIRIGSLSTELLRALHAIVTKAIINPPRPWSSDAVTLKRNIVQDDNIGLKIVGKMPLGVLARQTK